MSKFNNYYKAVEYIESLSDIFLKNNYLINRANPEIYLKRMRYFLSLIGNPDHGLNFIHITGTSGKGTVTNMLHEVIYQSGRKVGSFTSPFVTTTIEKTKVNDKYISPEKFTEIVNQLKQHIKYTYEKGPYGGVSYFEVCLAISLIYFKKEKCDWVVLEVGLGGKYDATNVIENPIITAITNIDYDHTDILGKTLFKIASDKSGIIKNGSRFFTTECRKSLIKLFKKICLDKDVEYNIIPVERDYMENNISLVTAIAESIGIKKTDIKIGVNKAKLQCRFEIIKENPRIIIDGAHNKAKIKSTINNLKKNKYNKLHLIVAISDNKDHLAILRQLVPKADFIYFTKFKNEFRKSAEPSELFKLSKKFINKKTKIQLDQSAQHCLHRAIETAQDDDVILITGSFFLAGEIRRNWYTEERVLRNRDAFK